MTCAAVSVRYEKYDKPMDKRRVTNGEDPFLDELDHLEATVEDLNKVSTAVSCHKQEQQQLHGLCGSMC
jgi:hypothetical protein